MCYGFQLIVYDYKMLINCMVVWKFTNWCFMCKIIPLGRVNISSVYFLYRKNKFVYSHLKQIYLLALLLS